MSFSQGGDGFQGTLFPTPLGLFDDWLDLNLIVELITFDYSIVIYAHACM